MAKGKKDSTKASRLAREQDLMRRMGEKCQDKNAAKSLGSPPQPRGWAVLSCFSYLGSALSGGGSAPAMGKDPLWGGDASAVEANNDDGFYRPMRG